MSRCCPVTGSDPRLIICANTSGARPGWRPATTQALAKSPPRTPSRRGSGGVPYSTKAPSRFFVPPAALGGSPEAGRARAQGSRRPKKREKDYFPDGLESAVRDLNGQRELYSYDSDGNQTLAIEADGIEQASQSPIRIERTFDGFDEPTQTRVPDPNSPGRYLATSYQYDLDGNTTGQVVNLQEDQGGSQTAAGRAFAYTYNDVDQVTAQTDDWSSGTPAEELTYTYTPTGQLSSRLLAGQTGSWTPEQEADYSYYQNGLLEQLSNYSGSAQSGTLVEQHTLSYIKNGVYMNGDQVSDTFMLAGPDASAPCRTSTSTCTAGWTYDARDRLISEDPGTGSGAKTYTLDAAGDVLSDGSTQSTYSGQRLVSQTTGGVTIKYLYDALGNVACQVTSAWTQATCPAAGNAALLQSYTYDYKNRLIADTSYDGSGSVTASASYVLDALDRTVSETETHSGATTTTQTVYQGDSSAVSKETLSGAQSETKTYAYDALGNAITLSDTSGGTTNRYSYLYDPRSSVSMLLDSTGAAKESYGYSAYGSKNASISKSASGFSTGSVPTNPVRFQGKRFDSGSGSYDMGARRYSAQTGRWLSQDIYYGALDNLGLSQDPLTANRYAFLGANPINYVEADGHSSACDYVLFLGSQCKETAHEVKKHFGALLHQQTDIAASIMYAPYYAAYTTQNWVHKKSHFLGHVTTALWGQEVIPIAALSLSADVGIDAFKKKIGWEKQIADEHRKNWHSPKIWLPGVYWHRDGQYRDGQKKHHLSADWSW